MSPRRTRAATAEQSAVSTRSKRGQNVNQDATKSAQKIRQSQKKEKTTKARNNSETVVEQSVKNDSPNLEVTFRKSMKKATRRRLNLDKGADLSKVQEDLDMNLSDSIKLLRDKHCDSIVMVELVRTNLLELNTSKDLEKMPNGKLQGKSSITNIKTSSVIVTPKSTPPKLNLTPHRSKKTPKKSPISLGSPKTHSIAVPKLFKSPRKLSLAAIGDNSEENLKNSDSDSHGKKSQKSKKNSVGNSSKSNKDTKLPATKDKGKKSDLNLKVVVRKFSKSPKIVLKSSKLRKSKSHILKSLSPLQMGKNALKTSPINSNTTPDLKDVKSSKINSKKSLSKKKSSPSIKHLLTPKLTETLTPLQMKDVLAKPVVLLEKLSPANTTQNCTPIVTSETGSDESSSTKLKDSSIEEPRINNTNKISSRKNYNKSIQRKNISPLMSSTPQDEKIASRNTELASNTSIDSVNMSFNTRLRHRNQSNIQLSNTMDKSADIENVSEPSLVDKEINDTNQSHSSNVIKQDATYDKDNSIEKEQKNNTYELEQPETLNLRQMIRKRTSIDANLSVKDTVKKAKVRFADISSSAGDAQKSINKLNGSQSSISHDVNAHHRNNVTNSVQKSKKVETPKFTQNSLISSLKRLSPRIHGVTPIVQLNTVQGTPKSFALVEKKSEKKSSTKKVPNFGRIHEQMFAKSESLVDAKKRLEARHLAFNTNKVVSKTVERKPLPSDTKDGIHNRFGFKLKKPEATHIILKKQTVFSREKQQHETRLMLKGVRTNRRFELQMRNRNLNS